MRRRRAPRTPSRSRSRPRPRAPARLGLGRGRGLLRRGRRGALTHETLLLDLAQLDGQAADQGVQGARQARDGRGDQAHELPVQDVSRGQAGDGPDLVRVHRVAVHHAALEGQQVGGARVVGDRLGGRGGIAADEGQRGRALEELLQRLGADLIGRPLGQGVLHDPEAGVGVAQLGAQLGRLRDRDAAVVHREHRGRLLDLGGDLFDRRSFLVSVHQPPSPVLRTAGGLWRSAVAQAAAGAASSTMSRVRVGSTFTPGPWVLASVIERM